MDGWILLIVGIASLAVVVAALGFLGWRAYRLVKRGIAVAKSIAPLAAELEASSRTIEARTAQLEQGTAAVTASLARLQSSVARLQVLGQGLSDGLAPYRRVRDYIQGNQS